jgi:methionine-R-sulfoxide reductase
MSGHFNDEPGILDRLAPALGVQQWVDASGQPLAGGFDWSQIKGRYKLIFCFQHACPGCHSKGFPTLLTLIERFRGKDIVGFAAVQTVFEDFEANSYENMLADQRRYALPIVFGHDAGHGGPGASSVLMQRFHNGGTPWFILIDPNGVVVFNSFHVDADRLTRMLEKAAASEGATAEGDAVFNWASVLNRVRDGNPPPSRRLELSEDAWRERLTPEQFHITRQKGTERAHSSPMCALFDPGRYQCVCCDTPLFDSPSKFKSRSGWPSFTQPLAEGVVAYHADDSHGMRRIEATCNVCDAHLGHVFPDGPPPSGLRYCMNAVALVKA